MKIDNNQKLEIARIAKKSGLKLVMVFGSFASGKNRDDSDMDVAVASMKEISFHEQIRLTNKFSLILKKNIDLSILNNANPLLLFQVSKNSILLYGNEVDFAKFKLYAFKSYNDYAPYFKMESDLNKKIINAYVN
ncbi:MAG: hypothetical protein US57_C0011G0033 [Candidatus Moranbacteria bacterium GW2011_GWC2_37_73]|nr:MAG: hypothetical protein UR95_C0006G0145 [Parcubacteria group bacterium GW2011_GWC1_36_108]KKQ00016.1 MAG: hypothetical protein US09_C0025G0008 [Candidatus Moranbacteria bacterium GW2011_GWD1_36_198]KKQ00381.1 MAG: hypothetical protein US10_C0033G0008 [Candidatus Moranbacteria bacterium GW2011_GWD2_36_198]KKQ39545.1 MAG: hypothetical protein US57_C0011G0033 [Candidatus Moranbacteria bacterium GW2011_GWC2_37_73]HAS00187.1 nucleotidyltransferase domain-containing protein [Candidatus Moranbact